MNGSHFKVNVDDDGARLLAAIADVHAEMKRFAVTLRSRAGWSAVTTAATVNRYDDGGSTIECYVDAERLDAMGFAWWLEATWIGGTWEVEASLLRSTSAGQDVLGRLGVSCHGSVELADALRGLTGELLAIEPPGPFRKDGTAG